MAESLVRRRERSGALENKHDWPFYATGKGIAGGMENRSNNRGKQYPLGSTSIASNIRGSQRVCVTGTSGRQAGGFDRGGQKFPGKRIFFKLARLASAFFCPESRFLRRCRSKSAPCVRITWHIS
jgi:hypothetical protein